MGERPQFFPTPTWAIDQANNLVRDAEDEYMVDLLEERIEVHLIISEHDLDPIYHEIDNTIGIKIQDEVARLQNVAPPVHHLLLPPQNHGEDSAAEAK